MKNDSQKNKIEKIDKEKIEIDGLSVYIEKFNKAPEVEFKRGALNDIQDVCITSILQGKDLLCRSLVMKKGPTLKRHLSERVTTWTLAIANLLYSRKKVLIIVSGREVGESVKNELKDLTRGVSPKIVTVFNKQEEGVENCDVLVTTATYGNQLLFKKKVRPVFDLLLIDECQKFNENIYFRTVFEIRRFLEPKTQVVVFSTTFSKENFGEIMSEERVVVEVESLGDVKQEVSYGRTEQDVHKEAVKIIKEGGYSFKGSWRDEVEIDKILVVVRDYNKIESLLTRERMPFRTLNNENKKGSYGAREEQLFKEGIVDKFKSGAFPILVVDKYSTRSLNLSGLSLVLSLDSSDSIRDYLFRSSFLKKEGKMVTFVSEENTSQFLEDLVCTLQVNKVDVPDFLKSLKGSQFNRERSKPRARKPKFREGEERTDLNKEIERITLTEDKDLSEDEELNVWA